MTFAHSDPVFSTAMPVALKTSERVVGWRRYAWEWCEQRPARAHGRGRGPGRDGSGLCADTNAAYSMAPPLPVALAP